MDDLVLQIAVWLEPRLRAVEAADPVVAALKQRVRDTTAAVAVAQEDDVEPALRAQDEAIWALLNHRGIKP